MIDDIIFFGFLFAVILVWAFPKIESWLNTYYDEQERGARQDKIRKKEIAKDD